MARPQARKTTTPTRGNRRDDLLSLSTEVLRLRLQALNLPIAGNRATLLASLRRARGGRSDVNAVPAGRIDKRQHRGARRQPQATRANANVSNATAPPVQASKDSLAAGETEAEPEDALSNVGYSPDDLFEDQTQPAAQGNAFSEAQMSVLCRAQFKRPFCNSAHIHSTSGFLRSLPLFLIAGHLALLHR